jgi:hypothetical protein
VRNHDQDVYAEPAQPNWVRYAIFALIGVVVVSFNLLFVGGFIKWSSPPSDGRAGR